MIRANLLLARQSAAAGEADKARALLDGVIGRESRSVWRDAARAERFAIDGRRSEAAFVLRQIAEQNADAAAAAWAQRRLEAQGAEP